MKQKNFETDPHKSPEYRQLSPKHLEDPDHPCTKNKFTKFSDREAFNETTNVLHISEKIASIQIANEKRESHSEGRQFLNDQVKNKESPIILVSAAPTLDQPSTSRAYESGNLPPNSGKKKTLGELAKEWSANQVESIMNFTKGSVHVQGGLT